MRHGVPRESAAYAADQLRRLEKAGGRMVTLWDDEYPELLKSI